VCVGADRVAAVRRIAKEGVDIVISDDGLQHYRMRRVMEIVVVDAERGFGNGQLLPAGPLREPVNRAYEADALIINGHGSPLSGFIFQLEQQGVVNLESGDRQPLNAFSGQRVWAVAGIGNPGRFTRQLAAAGLDVDEVAVPDHGSVSIENLLEQKNQPVFMTEKDAVKYSVNPLPNIWYVPVIAVCSDKDARDLMGILQAKIKGAEVRSVKTV
jgi:tetraacyldisaccharide 4'-kinase